MEWLTTKHKGFSLVEVLLSVAVFALLVGGLLGALIYGQQSTLLGGNRARASYLAQEGIEAVRNLRDLSFANLVDGTYGLTTTDNKWTLTGSSDTQDIFTRQITISSVNSSKKQVTSTVTWQQNLQRPGSITLTSYLSNWSSIIDGLMLYGDTTSVARPKQRLYTETNTFTNESDAGSSYTDTLVGKNFFLQTSPTKTEAIAGYVNNSGVLHIICFDGSTWTSEWTVTVGGTGTNDARFNIAFEKTTGDALVVYSTNTASTNEMAYRTKPGNTGCGTVNWAAATNINPARTSGIVQWIRMENSPVSGSNTIGLAWADANSDLSAMEWTGSSFAVAEPTAALETNLERVSASQDSLSFDIAFESTSGNLMVVWGLSQATTCTAGTTIATTNCIRYARYTTSWSAVAVIPTVADPATNIDLSSNPNSNEMALAALDNSQADLSIAYWSGSTWTGRANVDTTTQAATAGTKLVATGWLISGATTRYIVVYNDAGATNIGWYVANGSGAPAAQTDFTPTPVFANPQRWYKIDTDPFDKSKLVFTISDNNSDLFAKQLAMTAAPVFTWTNADGGVSLETSLGQPTSRPFGFAFWRHNL